LPSSSVPPSLAFLPSPLGFSSVAAPVLPSPLRSFRRCPGTSALNRPAFPSLPPALFPGLHEKSPEAALPGIC